MRSRVTVHIVLCLASMSVLALPGSSADWYVDPVHGSNASSGSSPGTAWRTISHALSAIPQAPTVETVHLAPGAYSAAGGEVFPLVLRAGLELVGDADPASAVIDGAGSPVDLVRLAGFALAGGPPARLASVTLRDADRALALSGTNLGYHALQLDDVRVTGMDVAGIWIDVNGSGKTTGSHPIVLMTRCELRGNRVGTRLRSTVQTLGSASIWFDARDSAIVENTSAGVEIGPVGSAGAALVGVRIHLDRCRLLRNGAVGLDASVQNGMLLVRIADCLVAGNPRGIRISGASGLRRLAVTRCSIVDSSLVGLESIGPASSTWTTLRDSILWDNGDDVAVNDTLDVTGNDIQDGDHAGVDGNIALDPLFRDPTSGDWRLRWDSPCIDRAASPSLGAIDIAGTPRTIDGDLDTLGRSDLGCIEFRPLDGRGTAAIGTYVGLDLWGASGATSQVLLSFAPATGPTSTPFGDLLLRPGFLDLGVHPADSWPPGVLSRYVPFDPALVGTTFTFQALTTSTLAPQGAAYTNAVSFVIAP